MFNHVSVSTYASRMSHSGWGGGIEMAACSRMNKVSVFYFSKHLRYSIVCLLSVCFCYYRWTYMSMRPIGEVGATAEYPVSTIPRHITPSMFYIAARVIMMPWYHPGSIVFQGLMMIPHVVIVMVCYGVMGDVQWNIFAYLPIASLMGWPSICR